MIGRLIRNLVRFFLWLLVTGGFIALSVLMMLANYLACKGSFELLGFEMRPLGTDELVGGVFGAFFPRAALAHFYALIVAITVAVGLFLVCKFAFSIADLWEARRDYIASGDQESAQKALRLLIRDLATLLVFLVPLVFAIHWDVALYHYRSIAGALGIEDPAVAPQMLGWERQLQENGDLFAWSLARLGAWGYIAVTAIACLSLELAVHKTVESWARLEGNVAELLQPATNQQEQVPFYGYDQDGQPAYDPDVPIAYDTDGNPVTAVVAAYTASTGDSSEAASQFERDNQSTPQKNGNGVAESVLFDPSLTSQGETDCNSTVNGPLFDAEPISHGGPRQNGSTNNTTSNPTLTHRPRQEPGSARPSSAPREDENALREVIGDATGARVTVAKALADRKHYWVDPETHQVWDASFRHRLLNEEAPQATA